MRSITLKLVVAFVTVSLLSTVLVVAFTRWRSREEFRTFLIDQNRPGVVVAFSEYYQKHGSWEGITNAHIMAPQPAAPPQFQGGPFTLVDPSSNRVVLAGAGYQMGASISASAVPDGIPIRSGDRVVGILLINRPVYRIGAPGAAFLDRVNLQILVGSLVAVGLALLLAIILARTLTRPIRELTLATQGVSTDKPAHQVPVRSRDELGQLAMSFNRMSDNLSRSLELRRQMTADIAHELRTPISIILGHAEAVHDGVLPASNETFEIIRDEAERLEHLVEDLRTLSMADAGELKLSMQPCSAEDLLRSAERSYTHQARQKDISIETTIQQDLPEIEVDVQRMREVVSNILDNALRYTPQGGRIKMSAARAGAQVEIRVQDTGPGVSAEDLDKVFERFYRTEVSRSRDEGGSGLGFAIARSLVEKHGGSIWAESQPGQGLTVIIQLPVPAYSAATTAN
ncbi:MAG TPA: ATP-binding protein [Anaerolineales bacterium]|nr:ATP-binding protein [Anaerolineales bacterium]